MFKICNMQSHFHNQPRMNRNMQFPHFIFFKIQVKVDLYNKNKNSYNVVSFPFIPNSKVFYQVARVVENMEQREELPYTMGGSKLERW